MKASVSLFGSVLVTLFIANDTWAAPACGTAIVGGKLTLDGDLTGCPPPGGLVVTGPATINLNGHQVSCDGSAGTVGIQANGGGVKILNGEISNCESGVNFAGEGKHSATRLFIHDCNEYGMYLTSSKNKITTCVVRGRPETDPSPTNDLIVAEPGADKNKIVGNVVFRTAGDSIDIRSNGNKLTGNVTLDAGDSGIDENDSAARGNLVKKNITIQSAYSGIELGGGESSVIGNLVVGSDTYGIDIEGGTENSTVQKNVVLDSTTTDLVDGNAACGTSTWKKNVFMSADPATCIH